MRDDGASGAGAKRLPALPALPTVAEAGVRGYAAASWYGALLPAGTPAQIVAALNRELTKAIKAPDVRERLASEGAEVVGSTPEELAQYMRNDIERWKKLAPALNLN
jgi:tripartite-type tricarboxylate transporter receptor subunit TctC